MGGHCPPLQIAHGLVQGTGCVNLVMAEAEYETRTVIEIKRVKKKKRNKKGEKKKK